MQSQSIKQKASQQTEKEINASASVRKCKKYFLIDATTKIYFNADFDSGNLEKVEQLSPYIYRLYPGFDRVTGGTDKTYFHFKVFGFRNCCVRFHITRVHILQKLLRNGQQSSYKPVVRKGKGKFEPIEKGIKIYHNRVDETELSIEHQFQQDEVWTQFSFSYPYSYEDLLSFTKQLKVKYIDQPEIYFHEEVLGYSQQGRKLTMLSITERINCQKEREEPVENIFPQRNNTNPKLSSAGLKVSKPKVIITGRVHPGQTPASYCIEGLVRFLLDEKDYRSYLLRKNFHFIIIPMLNPDGVYHGMFRNDLNGDNLNRLYLNCSKTKHPTIWCFRQYLKHLHTSNQTVLFYFDFHAHPSKKQFFIYGNAFNDFVHQVQAQTFGRLLENNCPYFHNIDSIFTEKQMNSKDKHDIFTKEGCARVYVHKQFDIIHSYTVECGYFSAGKLQKWEHSSAIQAKSQVLTQQYNYNPQWEDVPCVSVKYTPESYMLMGKSIPITILDLFHMNPYPRMNYSELRSIATIRKAVGIKIYNNAERFRMIDANVSKKIKEANAMLEEGYYKDKVGGYGLSISENYGMNHPKRTFSLLSRVYLSKKDLKIKLNNLDPQAYTQIEQVKQQNQQLPLPNTNNPNLFLDCAGTNCCQKPQQSQEQPEQDQKYLQHSILSHSTNLRQYKSQLQLKIPSLSAMKQSAKKLEQQYYQGIGKECLHVEKANKNVQSNMNSKNQTKIGHFKTTNQHEEEITKKQLTQNMDKHRQTQKRRKANSLDARTSRNQSKLKQKQGSSLSARREQNGSKLRMHSKSIKKLITQEKSQSNNNIFDKPQKNSVVTKRQNSPSSTKPMSQRERNAILEMITKVKTQRIDNFLKKQSNLSYSAHKSKSNWQKMEKITDLQRYITSKVNEGTNNFSGMAGKQSEITLVNKLPSIYSKH